MRCMVAVSRGTVEETAIPVTFSNVRPCWDRNCEKSMACSSPVRSALVAMRQWSTRSLSPSAYSPTTVSVFPMSTASSMRVLRLDVGEVETDVDDRCRMGDGADRDHVGAGVGILAHGRQRDAAGYL